MATKKALPAALKRAKPAGPYKELGAFFKQYPPDKCRQALWSLMVAAFGSSDADHWQGAERGNMLCFCQGIDSLLKATAQLCEESRK